MGCPYDFESAGKGGGAESSSSSLVLRGLSWLVTEAVACDFEDDGKEYMASAKQVRVCESESMHGCLMGLPAHGVFYIDLCHCV